MSTINKNIIANVIGKGWAMISAFLFIPFYINILGLKMFGVIGFYTVLQGALIFADAGLTATLRREMSLGTDSESDSRHRYLILRSIEFVYFFIVIAIAFGVFLGADFLANEWLEIEDLDPDSVKVALRLMGVALALNFLSSLYQGGLLGLEKQVASNTLRVGWGLLKNGGVIPVLLFIDRSLYAFFLWHLLINLIYILVLRIYIVRQVQQDFHFSWSLRKDLGILKGIYRYALGMLVIALIASLNNQLDKLVISDLIGVSDFAVYTVAFTLSMVPVVIAGPISVAIFPRLTKLHSTQNSEALRHLFNNAFKFVLIITSSVGVFLSFYSEFFLHLWTQDAELADAAMRPAIFLVIGQTLLSFQVIPFNLLLARGNTRVNIIVGALGLVILVPTLLLMVHYYGMIGAAMTWVIYYSIMTPAYLFYVIRFKTEYSWIPWSISNLFKPILLVIICGSLIYFFGQVIPFNTFTKFCYIGISSIVLFIVVCKFSFGIKGLNVPRYLWKNLFAYEN